MEPLSLPIPRLVVIVLGIALLLPAVAGAQTRARPVIAVRTQPAVYPRFAPLTSDYVVRCDARPVVLHVRIKAGAVAVDDGRAHQRSFTTSVGLRPGQAFAFSASIARVHRTYHVRCLPKDFPHWTYQRRHRPAEAFDIVTPTPYVAIFDQQGTPVWWYRAAGPLPEDGKLFAGDTIGWFSSRNPFVGPPHHEIHRLDGRIVRRIHVLPTGPGFEQNATDAHDIQALSNGDYLVADYKRRAGTVDLTACGGPKGATVFDAELQRVRPGVDHPVWTWNSRDHVAVAESARWCNAAQILPLADGTKAYDLVHLNSFELTGRSLLLAMRHTDAVYDVDYQTKKIVWKLGGTPTRQSLEVRRDPHGKAPLGGQHFARRLADGTVTLHDNGTFLGRGPRALRYRIDPAARTATLLEQVTDPTIASSVCCGSAQRMPDGAWLMSWGGSSTVTEFGPGGDRRFRLDFKGTVSLLPGLASPIFSYRVAPVPQGRLSRRALRAGMDAMHPRHHPA